MSRRLPPLNGLRAFEAAARHLSFTRAAEELNVTQAAISHQVKALEERLGVELFRRLNRQLLLTDAGQALLPALTQAFDTIADAAARIGRHEQQGVLTVATMDSFAATWLVPRLNRFREQHPDIDVRITTSDALVDFARDDVDVGIRYGRGEWPRTASVKLMEEEVFPVCAPALLEKGRKLETPADLRHFTLIHDDMTEDWRMWLDHYGVSDIDPTRGPGYHHSNLVIQSAIAGEGVALARSVLVADDIAAGRLVKPFDLALPAHYAYYIACSPQAFDRPKVKAFREWLLEETTPYRSTSPSAAE